MRKRLIFCLLALAIGLTALSATPATADQKTQSGGHSNPFTDDPSAKTELAQQALARAKMLFSDERGRKTSGRTDVSMVLRELFLARGYLSGDDRRAADEILARPTDGSKDPYGDGYTVKAKSKCSAHFCIHWVPTTVDKPPSYKWVLTNLYTMEKVWRFETGKLSYRRPITDGRHGGNSKFDVYLNNVGDKGYYGYCAAEYYAPKDHDLASGFCVLDNNFSFDEFHAKPINSMRVTAAHEFFHAIQYAYQLTEDRWLYESTATWMEERFADSVNDNRQYLGSSQIRQPGVSLDKYVAGGFWQYGNWVFFEYLSHRFGYGIVRQIWNQAGAFGGAPNKISVSAVAGAIASHKARFRNVYAAFAGANTVPARSYPEGKAYKPTPLKAYYKLSLDNMTTGPRRGKLNHLSSRSIGIRPADALQATNWRLRISVDLPAGVTGAEAMVIVHRKNGDLKRTLVPVDGTGKGSLRTYFSATQVSIVTVTLVNGSTRYDCFHATAWACRGRPLDDGRSFMVNARIYKA